MGPTLSEETASILFQDFYLSSLISPMHELYAKYKHHLEGNPNNLKLFPLWIRDLAHI